MVEKNVKTSFTVLSAYLLQQLQFSRSFSFKFIFHSKSQVMEKENFSTRFKIYARSVQHNSNLLLKSTQKILLSCIYCHLIMNRKTFKERERLIASMTVHFYA
ncbi:hypothetical protein ACKWTF_005712 [Chironomus riparius]